MKTEPTNEDLYAQISNCALSTAFNNEYYGKPSERSFNKLLQLRCERLTFLGIDDFLCRAEVDRYIKEHT